MSADIANVIAITGHRPDKLGGYRLPNPLYNEVVFKLKASFTELKPDSVIVGMALGADQWAAKACIDLGIPFHAAIPFLGFDDRWPDSSKASLKWLLEKAATVTVVSPPGYAGWKLQRRNHWMVDRCHTLLAVWDGSSGGTANCIAYAEMIGKPIMYVPVDFPALNAPVSVIQPPTNWARNLPILGAPGESKAQVAPTKSVSIKKETVAPVFGGRVLDLDE